MDIKGKAKDLCNKSCCHHKCKDTTDCVVEEEALLLINQDKSNNFDVKSNNELPSTLTNEEKVSVKVKQIEEIAEIIEEKNCIGVLCSECEFFNNSRCSKLYIAGALYNAGYRKQSEVIDEFAEKLKEAPIKCGLPWFGLSTKEEIEEYFNDIMLQVREAIDNIAKEMKGGEE